MRQITTKVEMVLKNEDPENEIIIEIACNKQKEFEKMTVKETMIKYGECLVYQIFRKSGAMAKITIKKPIAKVSEIETRAKNDR